MRLPSIFTLPGLSTAPGSSFYHRKLHRADKPLRRTPMTAPAAALIGPLILAGAWAAPGNAYKISVKGRYHERFTVWAERCLASQYGFPLKCRVPSSAREFTSIPYREGRHWFDSRWSDDPTRQSQSLGVFKFLRNVGLDHCVKYIGAFNAFPGLLCNGHYGTMQFFHSMASLQNGETVADARAESLDETRDKILKWTSFAFQVANGSMNLSSSYCGTVRQFGAAGAALAPPSFPFCDTWQVRTFFGFSCSNPLNSKTCDANVPDAEVRRAATGALLHMIQDSYSRSHTGRGETLPLGPYVPPGPQVRCEPITAFYRYTLEQKDVHGTADKAPSFSAECTKPDNMDPITASARMIWLVDNHCDESWARLLVAEAVMGNRRAPVPADVEICRRPIVPAGGYNS